MADKTAVLFGPVAMGTSAANLYNNSDSSVVDILRHIHVVNTDSSSSHTFTMFLSQTSATETAGKELFVSKTVAANDTFDWYCALRIESTDYIVGHADSATVTIMGAGTRQVA